METLQQTALKMKAAIRSEYGGPEVLRVAEVKQPTPKDNEVLVRVHAATVNRTDCGVLWGKPFIIRFFTGLTSPAKATTGTDFAGEVVAVGKAVQLFKVGDRVFGFNDNGVGSHAEYLTFPEYRGIALIPNNISYEQAAASLEGAHYAFNFINKVSIDVRQKVLVNGASGAIGSAMVQFLKFYGVYVTATCSTGQIELIKSLGVDKVIDYQKEDFTKDDEEYDFVLDAVGKSTFAKCKPLLKPKGVYISSELGPNVQNPFLALAAPLMSGKKVKFPIPLDIKRSIVFIKSLLEKEKFRPVIDRTYPLEHIREAFEYVNSGQKIGNVLISMEDGI